MKKLSAVLVVGIIVVALANPGWTQITDSVVIPTYVDNSSNGTPFAVYVSYTYSYAENESIRVKVTTTSGTNTYIWNDSTSAWKSSYYWENCPKRFTDANGHWEGWIYLKGTGCTDSLRAVVRRVQLASPVNYKEKPANPVTYINTASVGNGAWIECTTSGAPSGKAVVAYDSSGNVISTYGIKEDGTAPAGYFKVAVPTTVTITKFEARNADNTVYATDTGNWQSSTAGATLIVTDVSLPVTLSSFTAIAGDGEVTLCWTTESEVNNLGFNIYRADTKDGEYTRINPELIKGAGTSASRNNYSFTDRNVNNGTTYFYKLEDIDYEGKSTFHGPLKVTLKTTEQSQRENEGELPNQLRLEQNFPNPFNPETTIRFGLPALKDQPVVCLEIYNTTGQRVRSLLQGRIEPGLHQVLWDGRDSNGSQVASGVYLYVLKIGGEPIEARKMVLIR